MMSEKDGEDGLDEGFAVDDARNVVWKLPDKSPEPFRCPGPQSLHGFLTSRLDDRVPGYAENVPYGQDGMREVTIYLATTGPDMYGERDYVSRRSRCFILFFYSFLRLGCAPPLC